MLKRTHLHLPLLFIGLTEVLAFGQAAGPQLASDPVTSCSQARAILKTLHGDDLTPALTSGHKLLFIDPSVLQESANVTWKIHQPTKVGAVIRPDLPWEGNTIEAQDAPIWSAQEHIWKIWYASPEDLRVGIATSPDGIHWTKPSLGRVLYNGSTNNNIVSIAGIPSGSSAGVIGNVVYDPDDPDPNRRYKAFAGVDGRRLIVSADGVAWTALDVPPISGEDTSSLYYDRDNRLFIATIKHPGPYGRSVYLAVSRDFDNWTDSRDGLIVHADYEDQQLGVQRIRARLNNPAFQKPEYDIPAEYSVQVYHMSVMRYQGLYLGFPLMFHQTGKVPKDWPGFNHYSLSPAVSKLVHEEGDWTGFHQVELLSSRDLIHWQHAAGRQPILDESPLAGHPYDLQTIVETSPVVRGNEIWFYYSGLRRYGIISEDLRDNGAICLAKLRLDGFVSLNAGQAPGRVVTKPLLLGAGSLHLNVEATGGEVSVEIMDSEGKHVLEGFALKANVPVRGDHLDAEVKWKNATLSSLVGKRVCIRFTLRKADLYSAWVD